MTDPDRRDLAVERFPDVQYAFVEMLTEHLVDCRRVFGGDLDAMLVLAILGQNHIKAYLDGEVDAFVPGTRLGMSASRISDVAGIPRQTVRRKLALMAERGWLTRNSDAAWVLAGSVGDTKVGAELADLSGRGIARALRMYDEIARSMSRSPRMPKTTGTSAEIAGVVARGRRG